MGHSSTAVRISLFYAASFLCFGIQLPFLPVWLAARGLDGGAIAFVLAVPVVLRVTTVSLLGALADRVGDRRLVLILYSAATTVGALALTVAEGLGAIVAATALMALFWNGILPISDALGTAAARAGEGVYGRMRVWGSIAFVATNIGAGAIVGRAGAEVVPALLVAACCVQLAAAFGLGRARDRDAMPQRGEPIGRAMAAVIADRRLMAFLVGVALLQAAHAMLYGFSSLHWQGLGFSGEAVGILWATGVIGEIVLFTASGVVLARVGARTLLLVGGIGSVVRWLLFPLPGASMPLWVALQSLHAASFGDFPYFASA